MYENVLDIQGSFLLCFVLSLFYYWHFTSVQDYWKRRGLKSSKLQPILKYIFFPSKKTMVYEHFENYKKLGRIFGSFDATLLSGKPILVVGEPAHLRNICFTDSHVLSSRGLTEMPDRILKLTLVYLGPQEWKRVRTIITPTFTTGKIKRFLSIFQDSSKIVVQNFKNAIEKKERIELKRFYGAFAIDIIASAAFSTKIDFYNNPDNEFSKQASNLTTLKPFMMLCFQFLPIKITKIIHSLTTEDIEFFRRVVLDIIAERKATGKKMNDFLQLLMDAADMELEEEKSEDQLKDIAEGYIQDDEKNSSFKSTNIKSLTKDEVVAQCVLFFIAGYHSTAVVISFASFLLANNQDLQERAYQEINEVLKETDGEFTYEALQKMNFLDNVIAETLRMYPPFLHLLRKAEADYRIGDTKIVIKKGTQIEVPVYAMHHDPDLFPDPKRFDPDRFSPERKSKIVPYSYIPFGAGPRSCIGMRFALIEIKTVLVYVLSNLRLKPSPEISTVSIPFKSLGSIMLPADIVVEMEVRKDCILKD